MEEKITRIYKCPYCRNKYNDYDDAWDCAKECADIDTPEEDDEVSFICEYCRKNFNDEDEADRCEDYHIENKDKDYLQIKLKEASEHPAQEKLICS